MTKTEKIEVTTHNLQFHEQASIFSIDHCGQLIATAGGDTDVRIWSIATPELAIEQFTYKNALTANIKITYMCTLDGHSKTVNCVRFSQKFLASCSDGGNVLVYKLNELQKNLGYSAKFSDGDDVYDMVWNGDLLFMAQASGNVSVYRIEEIETDFVAQLGEKDTTSVKCEDEDTRPVIDVESERHPLKKRAVITKIQEKQSINATLLQTIKAHSDVVQGIAYCKKHNVLATQSKDRSLKLFTYDTKLKLHCKIDQHLSEKFISIGRSFFKRLSFIKDDFLFVAGCVYKNCNWVYVVVYPFTEIYKKIGPFDSTVQKIIEWNDLVIVLTKRSAYALKDNGCVFSVKNITFRGITDATIVNDSLMISSLDGFLSSIRIAE